MNSPHFVGVWVKNFKNRFSTFLLAILLVYINVSTAFAQTDTPYPDVTPQDLIDAFNALRKARGLPNLIVDPILMHTAQETADYMALNHMTGHIGDVRDRVIAAGYGAGDIPWATEDFMIGPATLAEIMQGWSDDLHMKPVNNPYYRHIGAGVSEYDGVVYYVVHAAYTSNNIYQPGATLAPQSTQSAQDLLSQLIFPVLTVTPQPDGLLIHVVKPGQSLWSIAIAYHTKIDALTAANNLSSDDPIIYAGQDLMIPVAYSSRPATPWTAVEPTRPIASSSALSQTKAVVTRLPITPTPAVDRSQSLQDRAAVYSLILLCTVSLFYLFKSGLIKVKSK